MNSTHKPSSVRVNFSREVSGRYEVFPRQFLNGLVFGVIVSITVVVIFLAVVVWS
jgi:hypothetical protein